MRASAVSTVAWSDRSGSSRRRRVGCGISSPRATRMTGLPRGQSPGQPPSRDPRPVLLQRVDVVLRCCPPTRRGKGESMDLRAARLVVGRCTSREPARQPLQPLRADRPRPSVHNFALTRAAPSRNRPRGFDSAVARTTARVKSALARRARDSSDRSHHIVAVSQLSWSASSTKDPGLTSGALK